MSGQIGAGATPSHWAAGTRRRWITSGALVLSGVLLLVFLAWLEARWLHAQPWHAAIRTVDYVIEAEGALPAWNRPLSLDQSVGDSAVVRIIQEDLLRQLATESAQHEKKKDNAATPFDTTGMLDLSYFPRAWLVMLDLPVGDWEPLLASGRVPVPGSREVLAGELLSDRALVIDGDTFTVTGRLRPQVAGFSKAYLMPHNASMEPYFTEEHGGTRGSVLANAEGRTDLLPPDRLNNPDRDKPVAFGPPVQTRTSIAWGVWFSLLLVAIGASRGFICLYEQLSRTRIPVISIAMQETVLRPRLIRSMHFLYFGGFFGAMALGLQDVEFNHFFMEYASHQFTDGGLKYVGEAYQSGDIPRAAHATFHNNFVMQTLYLSTGISLIPPFVLGLVKVLASFVVVGLAMAPLWTDTASGMTYHAITLALELPPYVLAGFGIAVWAQSVWQLIWSPIRLFYLGDKAGPESTVAEAAQQLPRGLLVMVGCTILTGIFLYVAAWYEAVTLILFR